MTTTYIPETPAPTLKEQVLELFSGWTWRDVVRATGAITATVSFTLFLNFTFGA